MSRRSGPLDPRRAARYAAVQALYQIDVTGRPATDVVAEFEGHRLDDLFVEDETGSAGTAVDRDLFQDIVVGATAGREVLDRAIREHLASGWSLERLGVTVRAMLRAGAFELAERRATSVATIIDEYVELARGFFEGNEPGFVHAVLDHAAPGLRAQAPAPDVVLDPGDR